MEKAVSKRSKFKGVELHSRDIDLVMRRFRREIPKDIRPEVDHILAIVLGGTALGLENHQILCAKCHKVKTKSDIKEKFARNPNPRKGVKFTKEHRDAMSKSRVGVDTEARKQSREENLYPTLRKPLIAINLKTTQRIEFQSLEECAKTLMLDISNISRVLRGDQKRTQHKGWTFEYLPVILESGSNEKDVEESTNKLVNDSNGDSSE